jgi:hypothetical protein
MLRRKTTCLPHPLLRMLRFSVFFWSWWCSGVSKLASQFCCVHNTEFQNFHFHKRRFFFRCFALVDFHFRNVSKSQTQSSTDQYIDTSSSHHNTAITSETINNSRHHFEFYPRTISGISVVRIELRRLGEDFRELLCGVPNSEIGFYLSLFAFLYWFHESSLHDPGKSSNQRNRASALLGWISCL